MIQHVQTWLSLNGKVNLTAFTIVTTVVPIVALVVAAVIVITTKITELWNEPEFSHRYPAYVFLLPRPLS